MAWFRLFETSQSQIVSILYSLLLSIASNFICFTFLSSCFFLVMTSSSSDIWKTLWILYFLRSFSFYVYFPTGCRTLKSPKNFASNFELHLVLMYLFLNQTLLLEVYFQGLTPLLWAFFWSYWVWYKFFR